MIPEFFMDYFKIIEEAQPRNCYEIKKEPSKERHYSDTWDSGYRPVNDYQDNRIKKSNRKRTK
jgi:hypothetical protein